MTPNVISAAPASNMAMRLPQDDPSPCVFLLHNLFLLGEMRVVLPAIRARLFLAIHDRRHVLITSCRQKPCKAQRAVGMRVSTESVRDFRRPGGPITQAQGVGITMPWTQQPHVDPRPTQRYTLLNQGPGTAL